MGNMGDTFNTYGIQCDANIFDCCGWVLNIMFSLPICNYHSNLRIAFFLLATSTGYKVIL